MPCACANASPRATPFAISSVRVSGSGAVREQRLDVAAAHQLGDDVRRAALLADVEDRDDVGVRAEAAHRLRLARDALAPDVVEAVGLDQRERDVAVEQLVVREEDALLAALAEEAAHGVAAGDEAIEGCSMAGAGGADAALRRLCRRSRRGCRGSASAILQEARARRRCRIDGEHRVARRSATSASRCVVDRRVCLVEERVEPVALHAFAECHYALEHLLLRQHLVEVQLRPAVLREQLARSIEVRARGLEVAAALRDLGEALQAAPLVDDEAHVGLRRPLEAGAEVLLRRVEIAKAQRERATQHVRVPEPAERPGVAAQRGDAVQVRGESRVRPAPRQAPRPRCPRTRAPQTARRATSDPTPRAAGRARCAPPRRPPRRNSTWARNAAA